MYKFLLPSWALFVCAQFKKSLPTKDHEDVLLRFKKKKKNLVVCPLHLDCKPSGVNLLCTV